MKNRRVILVAFLLVACMLVGIGYAVIEKELTIGGTATLLPQNFNVVFTQAKLTTLTDGTQDGVVPTVSVENTKLANVNAVKDLGGIFATSMTVSGLACDSDIVVVDFTIQNNNNVPMYLPSTVTKTAGLDVTGKYLDGGTEKDTHVLNPDSTVTYRVTVKLANEAIDAEKTETFNISIAATSNVPGTP